MFVDVEWAVDPDRGAGYECVYTGRFIQAAPGNEPDDDIMNLAVLRRLMSSTA